MSVGSLRTIDWIGGIRFSERFRLAENGEKLDVLWPSTLALWWLMCDGPAAGKIAFLTQQCIDEALAQYFSSMHFMLM